MHSSGLKYLICNNCNNIYYSTDELIYCPNYECYKGETYNKLYRVDENIVHILSTLNKNGVKTIYSCSGHATDNGCPYILVVAEGDKWEALSKTILKHNEKHPQSPTTRAIVEKDYNERLSYDMDYHILFNGQYEDYLKEEEMESLDVSHVKYRRATIILENPKTEDYYLHNIYKFNCAFKNIFKILGWK